MSAQVIARIVIRVHEPHGETRFGTTPLDSSFVVEVTRPLAKAKPEIVGLGLVVPR